MAVRCTTASAEISRAFAVSLKGLKAAVINTLCNCGETAVNVARSHSGIKKDYTDQTGNLRSSIGYIVVIDGKIVKCSPFEVVRNGEQGTKKGKAYAERLAKEFPKGFALIVVAGENYASYVQKNGYDVLASADLKASAIVPQLLGDLNIKLR